MHILILMNNREDSVIHQYLLYLSFTDTYEK